MTMPDALQILGDNRVIGATLSGTSGSSTRENLRDLKYDTVWESVGASDTKNEYTYVRFFDAAGNYTCYPFDRILLLNTNALRIEITVPYGATPPISMGIDCGIYTNLSPDILIPIPIGVDESYMQGVDLMIKTTQTANEEKYIGELKLCKHILTLNALTQFQRQDYALEGNFYTRSGALVRWREFRKFGGSLTMQNVTQAQRDALWAAYELYDFFVFCFFSEYKLSETYDVAIVSPPTEVFNRKTQLYEITLEVKER